jgi:tetratricopeptide (TPR) repeat protein
MKPLRIELPAYFNTPRRFELPEPHTEVKDLPNIRKVSINLVETEERLRIQKRLRDYELLAMACKRSKKPKDEGRAYYSMGVLYDNVGWIKKAIQCYHKFLAICKGVNDQHGEALAYNCLGVDYQLLGNINKEAYQQAINFHCKHRDISDIHGKFIAHINLGLLYASISKYFF